MQRAEDGGSECEHRLKDADIVDHLVELVEKKAAELETARRVTADPVLEAAK